MALSLSILPIPAVDDLGMTADRRVIVFIFVQVMGQLMRRLWKKQ